MPRVERIRSRSMPENHDVHGLATYASQYANVRPERSILSADSIQYNVYKLLVPSGSTRNMSSAEIIRYIPSAFIHFGRIGVVQISNRNIVALATINDSGSVELLYSHTVPEGRDIFILIPQVPLVDFAGGPMDSLFIRHIQCVDVQVDTTLESEGRQTNDCCICFESKNRHRFARYVCNHECCIDCVKCEITTKNATNSCLSCPLCRAKVMVIYTKTDAEMEELTAHIRSPQ